MSQQHSWGAPRHHQNPRLTPISTSTAFADQRSTPSSPSGSRPTHSPATSAFPSLSSAARHVGSRKSSAASSTSSPFSPSYAGQQPPVSQLLSSRSRTIAPPPTSQLASSAAATASQGGGGPSSSGGGASKLVRQSPSLSTSSTLGSPNTSANPSSAQTQNLSRIVIAQVFLLLSQFGPVKDEKDKSKWDTQTEQIRKLVDSNNMEVFSKYFRRLLQNNAAQIFSTSGRNTEPNGSYQILITEMQKLRQDPEQSTKIAESISSNEGDLFRDFDLSTFVSHFQLDSVAIGMLALACRKTDLRSKADAVLSAIGDDLLMAIARPSQPEDMTSGYLGVLVERLLQDPPQDWDEDKKMSLGYAVQMRYQALQQSIPAVVESKLQLVELADGSRNPLVKLVQRVGPQGTATIEACKEMLASAETRDISYQQVATVLLYLSLSTGYNAKNFVAALREHRTGQRLDWQDVVHGFDRDNLRIEKRQFIALYDALLPIAQNSETFDIQALWGGTWQHEITHLSFLMCYLSCSPDELDVSQIPRLRASYSLKTFENASDEVKAYAEEAVRHPFVSLEATGALFRMIFRTSDTYHQAQLLGIPDAVINPHTAQFLVAAAAVQKPWGVLQEQALKQLFEPYFHKKLPVYNFVLYGLWQQDPQWLIDRFVDAYNADPMSLTLTIEHAEANSWLEPLIRSNTDISLDLAAQAHARSQFQIEPWLQQTFEQAGPLFRRILTNFLSARAQDEMQRVRDDHHPLSLPLAVKTVYPLLWFLAECGLPEQELLPLQRNCIQAYPRLINYGEGVDDVIDANGKNGNALPEDADKKMQEHFKNMYSGESDVRDIISILKKYKESREPTEQDLFACMIHGLFDEYNCFGEYPLEALATTAVLFGGIINFNLLSRIALQVGLAMVLEAVQEYRPEDSMYKFGLQALLHFSNRLSEWPNYCDQLLIVPGLQGTEIYAKAEEVVGQVGTINGEGQNGVGLTNGNNVDEALQAEPVIPKFTCLHVDPPLRPELYEDPDEDVQDRVLFVLNNVSERNLRDKITDLTQAVEDRHHQWFANYLVEERAKMQPNFQQLYLDMLDLFNDGTLWAEVLRETYVSVVRMLNSETTLGSTERGHLKNLGTWLGSLTIARDQPIKFRNISFKDLLIEGYDTDRLLLVIPFTCKVLVQAAKSAVFRPPNPWLMEIIRVLMELYHFADLKLNQKFEIEVLCKGLDLDHKEIEASQSIRARPQPDEEFLSGAPLVPEGLEAFGDLSIMGLNRPRGPSERFSSAAITAALPDFTNQLQYPSGNSVVSPATLKKIFLTAVQQAIQEIIAPVVERSVTIAAISTSQLVCKDFAMEPDEEKLRSAAHTVVKSLSGALALVTCKEPLRMSIQNNIRVMARDLPEQALPEGHVLMFVNDNLDLVCNTVEQAAEMSSLSEIDMQIEEAARIRRLYRNSRSNEPFKDANISPWAFYIPEPYKQTTGGLNREQLAIYEDFGRQSRGVPHTNNTPQDPGRQVPDVLQDQFAAVPNLPTPAAAPAEPRQPAQQQPRLQSLQSSHAPPAQQQLNGYMEPSGPERGQRGVEELLIELTRVIKEAPEERISELQPTSPIHPIFEQLISGIEFAGPNKDPLAFRIAGQVTNHLFSDSLRRLEIETMAHLLGTLCQLSVQTSRQVLMWLATLHDDDRIFKANVMVALMDSGLMDVHRLNTTIAKAIQERRLAAVEMFSNLIDELLLNEHPNAFRADFALSIDSLTHWLSEDSTLEIGKNVITKLQASSVDSALTPPSTGNKDQLEYVFEEWCHLQHPDTPKKSLAAFIYQLHQEKVMKTQESSIEFIRTCIDASVASYEREQALPYGTGNPDAATLKIDALGKLIVDLTVYQGEHDSAVKESKAKYLDQILMVVILVLCNHQDVRGEEFNQKVFFRLFSTILFQLNEAAKDNIFAGFKEDIYLTIGKAFLVLQPRNFPRFTFSWLTLISHRIFIPAMLEDGQKDERWNIFARLMEALLVFTGQLVKPTGETIMAQTFYRGVLRVLLVIHHDYPEFLAENHFRFCNSIPMHCTQLRNLIVSAYPSTILEMPDPFSSGLKVERLDDSRQVPTINADIEQILTQAGVKETIDSLLQASEPKDQDMEKISRAVYYAEPKPAGFELLPTSADPALIHAIVLYIGSAALEAQGAKGAIFDGNTPAAKLLEKLVKELHSEAKFHFISAIANQLRWPNTHTHFFSYALLHLFGPPNSDPEVLDVQQTITRVLLERLLVHRPHPWGLIITLLEILKNRTYAFWDLPFVKAAPEVERLLNALFTHAQQSPRPLA